MTLHTVRLFICVLKLFGFYEFLTYFQCKMSNKNIWEGVVVKIFIHRLDPRGTCLGHSASFELSNTERENWLSRSTCGQDEEENKKQNIIKRDHKNILFHIHAERLQADGF
jgi:hypothetical protein